MTASGDVVEVLAAAGVRAVLGAADVGPAPIEVAAADWSAALAALHASGFVWFDHLTAIDEPHEDRTVVLLAVATADLSARAAVRTAVAREGGSLPTAGTLWAGALWAEREAFEMVGVGFEGHPDLRPLLLPAGSHPPLRHDVLLEARQTTPWPGHQDPADHGPAGAPARTGRRRTFPAGVDPDRAAP